MSVGVWISIEQNKSVLIAIDHMLRKIKLRIFPRGQQKVSVGVGRRADLGLQRLRLKIADVRHAPWCPQVALHG